MHRVAIIAFIVAVFSGCTGGDSTTTEQVVATPLETTPAPATMPPETKASAAEDSGEQVTIKIMDYDFQTPEITVKKGTKVTWDNKDFVDHTIKIAGTTSPVLGTGDSYSWTAEEAGTFDYQCTLHPSMKGKVIVE